MTFIELYDCKVLLHVFALFVTTIEFVSPSIEDIDYVLPNYEETINLNGYENYYSRVPNGREKDRLDPLHFYLSVFNPEYTKLPHPSIDINYKTYKSRLNKREEELTKEYLQEERKRARSREANNSTNLKYKQSEILASAEVALDSLKNSWVVMEEDEYQNIMMEYSLFPKKYEIDAKEFSDARLQVGIYLQKIIPDIKNPVKQISKLDQISNEKFKNLKSQTLEKGESYKPYTHRLAYYGLVPIPMSLCNISYHSSIERIESYLNQKTEKPDETISESQN